MREGSRVADGIFGARTSAAGEEGADEVGEVVGVCGAVVVEVAGHGQAKSKTEDEPVATCDKGGAVW